MTGSRADSGAVFAIAWIAFVLASACGSPDDPPLPSPWDAVDTTIDAWRRAGRDYPASCRVERTQLDLLRAPDLGQCADPHAPTAGTVVGCYTRLGDRPTLLVRDDQPERIQRDALVHELLHWLLDCSEGETDGAHFTAGVWACPGTSLGLTCAGPDFLSVESQAIAGLP